MIVTYASGSGWSCQSMAREQAVRRGGGYRWNRGSRPSTGNGNRSTPGFDPELAPGRRRPDHQQGRVLGRDLDRSLTPSTARRRLVVLYFGYA